ncbi:glycosyltransferase [candidate division KSB1 bacterium]|nr:glycosyltransferase [candidate division KSB1 bacterium]
MKSLVINATMLNEQSGGLGVYIRELLCGLESRTFPFDIKVVVDKNFSKIDSYLPVNINSKYFADRIIKEVFLWPSLIRKYQWDYFHSPMSYYPSSVHIPSLVTIHDLCCFHYAAGYSLLRAKYLQKMISSSAKRAEKIIAISEFTKQDLINTCKVPASKIKVVHNGINSKEFQKIYSDADKVLIRKRYSLPENYILMIGHLEPRKNYIRLLQSFKILKQKYDIKESLVIVGRENWKFQPIYDTLQELKLEKEVYFTSFVHQGDLAAIYQDAKVFVNASLFEGFGLTPLEAMAAGIPVAVSNATSHPEIVNDSGIYFDPYDPEDIARAIFVLLNDSDLQKKLVKNGYKNIKRFEWHQCCNSTFDLYEEIIV